MKVSLNWLKQYISVDLSTEEIADILTNLGLEIEGISTYERVRGSLQGLVIGEVLTCQRHPNADRLSLTTVHIGNEKVLNIVCGAPNVAAGQKVVVATEGTTLYPTNGEPFAIKKGKIRGEASEGMICAEDEIGLGASHDGIMILDANAVVGTTAADYFSNLIYTDTVFEIGLTPNRSDATGHIGVAFDLAAYLQTHHSPQGAFKLPAIMPLTTTAKAQLPIAVKVENATACPRYSGLCIAGVTVGESPRWLQNYLSAIGLSPINNIVDITNYILHEWGQPLHAFDYDQITNNTVLVKNLPESTPFVTLDGTERKLNGEDLMICNGLSQGMCIAGVFGGLTSGIKAGTTNIFLESAHFQPVSVRRTSMRHNLRTDAATRFEKGTDPNITTQALLRAAALILEVAGGEIASELIDLYPQPIERKQVTVRYRQVARLIGVQIPPTEIRAILQRLAMHIVSENAEGLTVAVPTNKADVTREADVIEEILRIYGYNRVETPTEVHSVLAFSPKPDPLQLKNTAADLLAANGFFEMMATSMSRSAYYAEADQQQLVFVHNTSNQHLDIMRPDMAISGLEAILHNQNRQQADVKLFEFGKTYHRIGDDFKEVAHLSLFLTGRRFVEDTWLYPKRGEAGYYTLKSAVELVLQRLGINIGGIQKTIVEQDAMWGYAMRYHKGNKTLVSFGRVSPQLTKKMDIRQAVFFADFAWDEIIESAAQSRLRAQSLPKFPAVRRDLAMLVDSNVRFEQILSIAQKQGKQLLRETHLFDIYENAQHLGDGKKSYAVSFLFQDETKTLEDKDIDALMQKVMEQCEKQLGAVIRK